MKKFLLSLLLFIFVASGISVFASNLKDLPRISGTGTVNYRNTTIPVQIPDTYEPQKTDFRAAWISHLVSDLNPYENKEQYQAEINKIFNIMEYYNMNAMIFHVRTHNNALYKSELNPIAPWWRNVNFEEWDPLAWIIEEAHKRGIEFHAWLNPYRLDPTMIYPDYNIASNSQYTLQGSTGYILNPGEPKVREFVIDSCMEIIENYDVDAIHFDDYFYIQADDSITRAKYNVDNLPLGDFRRKQIDTFIYDLSTTIREYNRVNKRTVQLGISPTGIYKNGDYVPLDKYEYGAGTLLYPTGSNTSGFTHFDEYLYCDTKKWIDNEWIDYVIPQTYNSFEESVAAFAATIDWWSAVVKYKNVNLYAGMGIYKILENQFSWPSNTEAYNQVLYGTKNPEIQGHSLFSFKHIKYAYERTSSNYFYENMSRIKEKCWTNPAILPEVRNYRPIYLTNVENLSVGEVSDGYQLVFSPVERAKFYVIYRSTTPITFAPTEVVDIVGNDDPNSIVIASDKVAKGQYYYAVRTMSSTNSLGDSTLTTTSDKLTVTFKDFDGKILKTDYIDKGASATAPQITNRDGYQFIGWDKEITNVTTSMIVTALYDVMKHTVTFKDNENQILSTVSVNHGDIATPPNPDKAGYKFISWNHDLANITSDLEVIANYEIVGPKVSFFIDNVLVKEYPASISFTLPSIPAKIGYDKGAPVWNKTDFSNTTTDIRVDAIYTINTYTVKFIGFDGKVLKTEIVVWNQSAIAPTDVSESGYEFTKWNQDFSNISSDLEVTAEYVKTSSCKGLSIYSSFLGLSYGFYLLLRRRSI